MIDLLKYDPKSKEEAMAIMEYWAKVMSAMVRDVGPVLKDELDKMAEK